MEQTKDRSTLRRLHIGGLSSEVTMDELKEKFNNFGKIQDVEIKTKKDVYGEDFNTFAYINIVSDESALNKCFSIFNKAKWKGRSLQIHFAKEHFLKRLDEERKCPIIPVVKKVKTNFHNPLALIPEVEDFNMKGKVPGTPIPGEKKWVVGKYGRILPIVNVRNRSLNKCIYYDPSKYCHNLKKLKEEEENERLIDIDDLTWKIESDTNTGSSKRRRGDFSEFESYVPKRVKLNEDYWSDEMQEKMEELRRRYLEKDSEEICQKFEDDIEIVKSGKTVSSEYHIPKTDFIYDSDEQLSNDEEQFQHLSVLGEATSVGYDSAGSADTDEIIAMNASRSKAGSSKNSVTNKEQITPLKKPVVNELVSKPNIDQVLTIGDKISPISKLPLKTQQNLEIVLSYVDNTMKQIPFRGMAMLDCESMERVTKTTIQSEGESESDTKPENEIDDSGESKTNKLLNDNELDSDDFEKVAIKYSGSLSVPKVSDIKLDIIKTNLQEKNISNKILTESDSEDTDDMIKKLKSNEKTTKLIVTSDNHSDKTDTCHSDHNDTSMLLNISNKNDTSTDSDLDSDDFEKVAGKYLSFVEKDTITSSKLINDCDDGSTVDDDIVDKSSDFKDKLKRNESECMVRDKSIDDSEDDAGVGMKETDQDRIDSSYDESSDDDNSNSDEESDSINQSDDEDASENINGNKQGVEDTSSEDSNNNDDEKDGDDDNSDDDDDDGHDDKDEDDDEEDDDESENDEDNDEGNEDSKKKGEEEDESQQNKNFFVSSSLFSAFVKREQDVNSGFSFLKTFGNQNTSEPKKLELPRNLRKQEETESDKSDEIEENQIPKSSTSFFFQPKDVRLQEGVQFFHRKLDIEEIEDKWNQVKPVFLATCRQRNRLALKRLDQEKLKKRKMTFTKSFMSKNRK